MKYYILKQFIAGSQIWVWKLNQEDEGYVFDTQEQAQVKLEELKQQNPNQNYKISTEI
jgi:hypothetical protein